MAARHLILVATCLLRNGDKHMTILSAVTIVGERSHLERLPIGTILQSVPDELDDSDEWDALAYKCTDLEWSVTGHNKVIKPPELGRFAKAWLLIRWGK